MKFSTLTYHICLILLAFSCKETVKRPIENLKTEDSIELVSKTPQEIDIKVFLTIKSDEFIKELEKQSIEKLPFSVNQNLLHDSDALSQNEERNFYRKESDKLDKYLTLDLIPKNEIFFATYLKKPNNQINFKFVKRFPPFEADSSIECLLFSSIYDLTYCDFWVLTTFDKKAKRFVDFKTVAVFKQASDMYYDSGFSLDENYLLKSTIKSYYESPINLKKREFKIQNSGNIKTIIVKDNE